MKSEQGGQTFRNIQVSTKRGLACLNLETENIRRYNHADGLPSDEFSIFSYLSLSNGDLAFGTTNGLVFFDPKKILLPNIPKAIPQVTKILVNDHDLTRLTCAITGATNPTEIQKIQLKFWQNTLSFYVASLEYSNPSENKIRYSLNGVDTSINLIRPDQLIHYADLEPGNYKLEIWAANSSGIWNPVPRVISIYISLPFWQTWWFILLCSGLISGYFYLFVWRRRLRMIQLKLEHQKSIDEEHRRTIDSEMKALRAQMNPHFIFNSINSINAFILTNQVSKASEYLNKFADLIRTILNISSKETISLLKEVDFLKSYLSAESIRMKDKLDWEIKITDDIDTFDTYIPSMILQPFIENAIWHGISPKERNGKILIEFTREGNSILVVIEDNGIGRDESERIKRKKHLQKESQGMAITRERLAIYDKKNGTTSMITIADLKDHLGDPLGTKVNIKIMLRS